MYFNENKMEIIKYNLSKNVSRWVSKHSRGFCEIYYFNGRCAGIAFLGGYVYNAAGMREV